MAKNFKGSLIGGFDLLRVPDAPTVSGTAGADSIDVVFTDPSDVGGGSITSRTASATDSGGTVSTATGTGTTVTISSLSTGSFTIGGFVTNDFGNSVASATVSVSVFLDRALFFGGHGAANDNRIDYIAIASTANAQDFGDLGTLIEGSSGGAASSTRGVVGAKNSNVIQYVTFASLGNTSDFGDRTLSNNAYTCLSNSTRGVLAIVIYSISFLVV